MPLIFSTFAVHYYHYYYSYYYNIHLYIYTYIYRRYIGSKDKSFLKYEFCPFNRASLVHRTKCTCLVYISYRSKSYYTLKRVIIVSFVFKTALSVFSRNVGECTTSSEKKLSSQVSILGTRFIWRMK